MHRALTNLYFLWHLGLNTPGELQLPGAIAESKISGNDHHFIVSKLILPGLDIGLHPQMYPVSGI